MTAQKLAEHADSMAQCLKSYVEGVKHCFNHVGVSTVSNDACLKHHLLMGFQSVAAAATRDEHQVMLRRMNVIYGLPENHIQGSKNLYPTIPTSHIADCTMKGNYFGSLAIDKQANLVALAYIMVKGFQQRNHKSYSTVVNDGDCHYGDSDFRGLTSFRTT